mgnify:CR=1 FL=1
MTILRAFTVGGLGLPDHEPISLGTRHPSSISLIRIQAEIDGDEIVAADVANGYGHRGAEKLFEVREKSTRMLNSANDTMDSMPRTPRSMSRVMPPVCRSR